MDNTMSHHPAGAWLELFMAFLKLLSSSGTVGLDWRYQSRTRTWWKTTYRRETLFPYFWTRTWPINITTDFQVVCLLSWFLVDALLTSRLDKILWPLLHYQMHEIHLCQPDWESYREANRCFAESLVPALREGDCVWIQDYHLLLLPFFLRQSLNDHMNVQIGFFLHTVFPASDFFRILPVRKDILAGLLNCDLIGFHNPDYTEHFLQCCRKIMYVSLVIGNRNMRWH